MIYVSNEPYLEHHGIKGQKWGVRRNQAQLGHRGGGGVRAAVNNRNAAHIKSKQAKYTKQVHKRIDREIEKHPDRSKRENVTNALNRENTNLKNYKDPVRNATNGAAGIPIAYHYGLSPVGFAVGAGVATATAATVAGRSYVGKYRDEALSSIYSEYNVRRPKDD